MLFTAGWALIAADCLAAGEPGAPLWEMPAPDTGDDTDSQGRGVCLDPEGNVIVTGYIVRADGNYDMLTAKYRPDGEMLWSATYDYSWHDIGTAVASGADGSVFVAGASYNFTRPVDINRTSYYTDYALLKYAPGGSLVFETAAHGNDKNNLPAAVCAGPDGAVYVTGTARDAADTHNAYYTVKFGRDGSVEWEHVEDWGTDSSAVGIGLVPGGVLVTGHAWDPAESNYDIMTLLYSPDDGSVLALATYKTPGFFFDETASGMAAGAGGGAWITGRTSEGDGAALTLRLDPDLRPLWAETMSVSDRDSAGVSIGADERGRSVVMGWTQAPGGVRTAVLMSYAPDGRLEEFREVLPGRDFLASDEVIEPDGDVVVVGTYFEEGERDVMAAVRLPGYPSDTPGRYDLEAAFARGEPLALSDPPVPMLRKARLEARTVDVYGCLPSTVFVADAAGMPGLYEYRFFVTRGASNDWEKVRGYSPLRSYVPETLAGREPVTGVMVQVRPVGSAMEYQAVEYIYLDAK